MSLQPENIKNLILKRKNSLYTPTANDQRTFAWRRSKDSVPVDDEIWVGTFSGDRIGYLPRH